MSRLDLTIVELLAAGYNARGTEVADLAREVMDHRDRHPDEPRQSGGPWRLGRRRSRHVYRADVADDAVNADVATFMHADDAAQAVADRNEVAFLREQVADLKAQIIALTPPVVISRLSEGHYPEEK